jgi:CheY-like chemotaxis protein
VHFISGADHHRKAIKMGAVSYLKKPISLEKLEETFQKIKSGTNHTVKKMLIIEDDRMLQKTIFEFLKDQDLEISTATTGQRGLELIRNEKFDCVTLDLGLGDMSGIDLLKELNNDSQTAHVPTIVYTGKDLNHDEKEFLDQAVESVIFKGERSLEKLLDETTLFLHRVEDDLSPAKQKILKVIHDKEKVFQNKKVLIVDDDIRNVFALSNLLESKGMQIVMAQNGKEGLKQLEENPDADLVLMDIMMPEMDGFEAMKKIRTEGTLKDIPIITLTAKAMRGDRKRCIEAGASDYLSKPVDQDKLLSLMRIWLY